MSSKLARFVNRPEVGLLILRVVTGAIFVAAGVGKFASGAETLKGVGSQLGVFGITFAPLVWGILAAASEAVGGVLLIIGAFTRWAAFFLLGTMIVAVAVKINGGGDFVKDVGYPLTMAAVSMALIFTGPGRYAIKP